MKLTGNCNLKLKVCHVCSVPIPLAFILQKGLRFIMESLGGDEIDGLNESNLMDFFGTKPLAVVLVTVACVTWPWYRKSVLTPTGKPS